MALTLIVSAITEICDRLIGLIKDRDAAKRKLFESEIQPLFDRLLAVHQDYVGSIAEIADLLENNRGSKAKIRAAITSKQREFAPVRQVIIDLGSELGNRTKDRDNLVASFARAVYAYFFLSLGPAFDARPVIVSRYRGLLTYLAEWENERITRAQCAALAREIERKLPDYWKAVSQAYAKLRIASNQSA